MKIFALSDTHGDINFKLPEADLILHAGDICPDFFPRTPYGSSLQAKWLNQKWLPWCAGSNMKATLGNHDFLSHYVVPKCVKLNTLFERDGLKIWFSPWSNEFCGWAWMKPAADLQEVYDKIPACDILVSHQPPYGYGDRIPDRFLIGDREDEDPHVGSKELLTAIDRVKPRAVICGHIHVGYGVYQHGPTTIYNVSLLDDDYKRVNEPMEILL